MAADMEKARVTELYVRMDCNGCVQRIKKAINSVEGNLALASGKIKISLLPKPFPKPISSNSTGVHNVYVDRPQQKLTVVGQADPATLVRAIKKTRKTATISSHTEPSASDPPPSTEPEAKQDNNNPQSSTDAPPVEPTPPTDPPKEPPPQENPAPESSKPSQEDQEPGKNEAKDVDQVHMMHHYPDGGVVREHWNDYPPMGHQFRHEAPYYVTHSYDNYRPSPYVTEYGYVRDPPQDTRYRSVEPHGGGYYQNPVDDGYNYQNRVDEGYYQNRGGDGYYQNRGSDGNQVSSIFSDENPNACRIA